MAVAMIGPKFYAWDRNGKPLAFGKLYTYQARTNTPKATYQSEDQVVENTNPVILNGEGYANVYLDGSYKMVLKDDKDNEIWSSDPVSSNMADEWVNCLAASYLSPTSFKVTGNHISTYEIGRKVRLDSGTTTFAYAKIIDSSYSNGETVIVVDLPVVLTGLEGACVSIIGVNSSFNVTDLGEVTDYVFENIEDMQSPLNSITATIREGNKLSARTGAWLAQLQATSIALPNSLYARQLEPVSAEDFGIVPGQDVTAEINALAALADGLSIYFNEGEYIVNGALWQSISNFELSFHPNCVFKLDNGANTFAFRISACSNFNVKGVLRGDGNKDNNTPGGSSPSAANATIAISGSNNFTVDHIKCVNGWTNGVTIDGSNTFVINSLEANDTARRGVTVTACTDFYIGRIISKVAIQNNCFYIIDCQRWAIDSVQTEGAQGSNGALFEVGNQHFYVGSVVDTGSYSGIKFEECYDWSLGYAFSKDTTVSHCFTLNKVRRYSIGAVITENSIDDGVAFLAADMAHTDGHVGSIISRDNGNYGVQCQQTLSGFFSNIRIDCLISSGNGKSNFEMDGGIIENAFSVGYFRGSNPGAGFWDIEDNTPADPVFNRAGFDNAGQATSNYSNVPVLSVNSAQPNVGQYINNNSVLETGNTAATTVTKLSGYTGITKVIWIAINDSNTTFANGSSGGGIVVQGASVAANFGEMWQATYRNDFWYLHKVS